MKKLLLIVTLIPSLLFAQNKKTNSVKELNGLTGGHVEWSRKCDLGYTWVPSIATANGAFIIADTCLPDSAARRIGYWYNRCNCIWTGISVVNKNGGEFLMYTRDARWNSVDSTCLYTSVYKKKVNQSWQLITDEEFNRLYIRTMNVRKGKRKIK